MKILQSDPAVTHIALRTWSGFFALGFGSGLAARAPGTAGTLAAIPLAIPLLWLPAVVFWPLWTVLAIAGVYWCEKTGQRLGIADPGCIVWDEMIAIWLVLAMLPFHWTWWLFGFVVFRFFDIFKPWPIRWLEHRVSGGLGVMVDDLLAAFYSLAVLWLSGWLLNFQSV